VLSDHQREEGLSVHVHRRQVDPRDVQQGRGQIDAQHRSLEEEEQGGRGRVGRRRKKKRREEESAVRAPAYLCVRVHLQRLLGLDSGASDHQRDSDVELVQLPVVDGQRELT